MPGGGGLIPGTAPAKTITIDKSAKTTYGQVLDKSLKLKALRVCPARTAPAQQNIPQKKMCPFAQVQGDALKVATTRERNRRAGKDDQDSPRLNVDVPLLGAEAAQTG